MSVIRAQPDHAPGAPAAAPAPLEPLRFYRSRGLAYVYAGIAIGFTALAGQCWHEGGVAGVAFAAVFGMAAAAFAIHFGLTWPFVKPGQREPWLEVSDDGLVLFGITAPWKEIAVVRLAKREPSIPPMHHIELVFTPEAAAEYGREHVQLDVLRCEGTTPHRLIRDVGERVELMRRREVEGIGAVAELEQLQGSHQ